MFPPVSEDIEIIGFSREPYDDAVKLYFQSGDTYRLSAEEAISYLKLLHITTEDLDVVSYVWNFYTVFLFVKEKRMESCTKEQLREFFALPA